MSVVALRESGLPEPPGPEIDRYLDAALRCIARFGLSRTRVTDVADELGVSRVTVYRQVGNVEHMARLLFAREVHRLAARIPDVMATATGPEMIIRVIEFVLTEAHAHPVLQRVLADDVAVAGPYLTREFGEIVDGIARVVEPLIAVAVDNGHIASTDTRITAEWLVRLTFTLLLAPPPGDLHDYLAVLLEPALRPTDNP